MQHTYTCPSSYEHHVNDQLFAKAENGQLCYCSLPPPRSNTTTIDVDMVAATIDNPNNCSQDKPTPVVLNDTLPMSAPGSDSTVHSVQSHPFTYFWLGLCRTKRAYYKLA